MGTPLTNDFAVQTTLSKESVKFDLSALEQSALNFLAMSPIVNSQGEVLSWLNTDHPGYVYPEIMGYYLTFGSTYLATGVATDPLAHFLTQRVHQVAQRLQTIVSPVGGIGKSGYLYLFDTAIAVTGLLAYHNQIKGDIDESVVLRMVGFMERAVTQQHAVFKTNGDRAILSPHWSTVFGSSMVKCAIAFNRVADWTGQDHYHQLGRDCITSVIANYCRDGAFPVCPQSDLVYTHAHCYALEGLLDLHTYGADTMADLRIGADWLEQWQNRDGSLLNWNRVGNRPGVEGPVNSLKIGDATAQALRIWIAVDGDRYQRAIRRGFRFLQRLAATHHGFYYGLGSRDVNAWVTLFTAQALAWYGRGAVPRDIV